MWTEVQLVPLVSSKAVPVKSPSVSISHFWPSSPCLFLWLRFLVCACQYKPINIFHLYIYWWYVISFSVFGNMCSGSCCCPLHWIRKTQNSVFKAGPPQKFDSIHSDWLFPYTPRTVAPLAFLCGAPYPSNPCSARPAPAPCWLWAALRGWAGWSFPAMFTVQDLQTFSQHWPLYHLLLYLLRSLG